jgi:hypothetical protein
MKALKLWMLCAMCWVGATSHSIAQEDLIDLGLTTNYRIAGLTVLGAEHTDVQAIKLFSSLQVGQEIDIPGEALRRAITGCGHKICLQTSSWKWRKYGRETCTW